MTTNTVKHTPGPWRVEAHDGDIELVARPTWPCKRYGEKGEWTIARVFDLSEDVPGTEDESHANGCLIAAAPDLLEASTALIAAFDELRSMTLAERIITGRTDADLRKASNEAIKNLRAALAKAHGLSPESEEA